MSAARSVFLRRRLVAGGAAAAVVVAATQLLLGWPMGRDAAAGPFAGQLLVYGRHALTDAEVASLRAAVPGRVTPVYGGEVSVASGRADFPEIPVQTLTVDPAAYAAAAHVPRLKHLLASGVVLSATGARLRHLRTGELLPLADGRRLRVSGIVEDALLGGHEAATATAVLGHRAGADASYLFVAEGRDERATERALRAALPDKDLRIQSRTRNGILSSADTVLTQEQIKTRFGEFALKVDASGSLHLDPRWVKEWIVSTTVPQLGVVACNRDVVAPLRAAMTDITQQGLGALVHTADFQREGGCWSPRVARFGAGQLSAHAWGIAVDINVDVNPLGAAPHQDPRLVAIMSRHGFSWGGRFLRPDGAHFEWTGDLAHDA